jgi:ribosome maturation factor RimP
MTMMKISLPVMVCVTTVHHFGSGASAFVLLPKTQYPKTTVQSWGPEPRRKAPVSSMILRASPAQDDQPLDMKSVGSGMILAAAVEAGATEPMIHIDWRADRIIVTVDVSADESFVADSLVEDSSSLDEEEWEDALYDIEDDVDELVFDEDNLDSLEFNDDDDVYDDFTLEDDTPSNRIDVTKIARAINDYLSRDGEDSIGYKIAELHEIEVTTPEFDNVLRGDKMFESYKGFDVVVEHWEENKQRKKKQDSSESDDDGNDMTMRVITEGKLVGRDKEKGRTMVNVKGRIKNIKNEMIECVRLPKAKREKGAK